MKTNLERDAAAVLNTERVALGLQGIHQNVTHFPFVQPFVTEFTTERFDSGFNAQGVETGSGQNPDGLELPAPPATTNVIRIPITLEVDAILLVRYVRFLVRGLVDQDEGPAKYQRFAAAGANLASAGYHLRSFNDLVRVKLFAISDGARPIYGNLTLQDTFGGVPLGGPGDPYFVAGAGGGGGAAEAAIPGLILSSIQGETDSPYVIRTEFVLPRGSSLAMEICNFTGVTDLKVDGCVIGTKVFA